MSVFDRLERAAESTLSGLSGPQRTTALVCAGIALTFFAVWLMGGFAFLVVPALIVLYVIVRKGSRTAPVPGSPAAAPVALLAYEDRADRRGLHVLLGDGYASADVLALLEVLEATGRPGLHVQLDPPTVTGLAARGILRRLTKPAADVFAHHPVVVAEVVERESGRGLFQVRLHGRTGPAVRLAWSVAPDNGVLVHQLANAGPVTQA
jgi:hypothetical protein